MFEVEAIERLEITGPADFTMRPQMSPFVWRDPASDDYRLLARSVPEDDRSTGSIWLGCSSDGLRFRMQDRALIVPNPGTLDARGCEDPTVLPTDEACIVYYTGVDQDRKPRLLYAEGPDLAGLTKRGIAHATSATEHGTKEATVECLPGDDWRLFFEYSRGGRSRVGIATSCHPQGPWQDSHDPFEARPGRWDSWHLSPGPIVRHYGEPGRRLMFYNGATRQPRWAIGWVVIDDVTMRETLRCETPLIAFDNPGQGKRNFAFASSLVVAGARIWLYLTRDDRVMLRATLRLGEAEPSPALRLTRSL